jgi:hypothetical protein
VDAQTAGLQRRGCKMGLRGWDGASMRWGLGMGEGLRACSNVSLRTCGVSMQEKFRGGLNTDSGCW